MVVDIGRDEVTESYDAIEFGCNDDRKHIQLQFRKKKYISEGTFATVYSIRTVPDDDIRALKRVVKLPTLTNELKILQRCNGHPNICKMMAFFYSRFTSEPESHSDKQLYHLNILLEFLPTDLLTIIEHYKKDEQYTLPLLHCKLYAYQLLRGLNALHGNNICHQDLKPSNLLVDPRSGVLKICDFSNSSIFEKANGEPCEHVKFVQDVCSLFYRAPEHLIGTKYYTLSFDLWSAGCTLAELFVGEVLFQSDPAEPQPQLNAMMQVLGCPDESLHDLDSCQFKCQQLLQTSSLKEFLLRRQVSAVHLVGKLVRYTPASRMSAKDALAHPFFEDLHHLETNFKDGVPLPKCLFE
ncbi:kinase-like domain-containing protein [Mycotypha africana]|uniref:kinase-like domain-containing protein n=1 Tax=Mycotypha africana TaxID=64632 RepID=UPI0023007358|nr:kinase-like domain-containing protein [Mycotypha africana]KAI8968328.1 kinase-like domain-containing protein [Mycotypha africana]